MEQNSKIYRVEAVNPYDADPDFQEIVDVPVTVGWRK